MGNDSYLKENLILLKKRETYHNANPGSKAAGQSSRTSPFRADIVRLPESGIGRTHRGGANMGDMHCQRSLATVKVVEDEVCIYLRVRGPSERLVEVIHAVCRHGIEHAVEPFEEPRDELAYSPDVGVRS